MSHAAKQAALEAYAGDKLSPAGRKRVDRHLASCDVCRALLGQIRAYALLREDAQSAPLPELSWERMSAALDKPLPVPSHPKSRTGALVALAWPLLSVAATLLIAWIGMTGGPEIAPKLAVKDTPSVMPTREEQALTGRVTLVAGKVYIERSGERIPLTLGSVIEEHALLVSEPGATAHVMLRDSTGFVLGSDSRLHVAELREQGIHLELTTGSVHSRVQKLGDGQRYSVATADFSSHVRGTRFLVEKRDALRVFVHEGKVEVTQRGKVVATLLPGQGFESPKHTAQPPDEPSVHGIGSLDGAALTLPALPSIRAWVVDGTLVPAQSGLAMRVPPGATTLSFLDLRGHVRTLDLTVDEAGTTLDEVTLGKLTAPAERTGHLEPDQITAVVRAGLDPLRRCYERALKTAPDLAGKLTLSLRVAADGHVQRAQAEAAGTLPPELSRCITQEASKLRFPRPEGGGGLSFEVPLNLKSSR